MWFIFPQIAGLGDSGVAKTYLQHPTQAHRLRACTQLVLEVNGRSAEDIFPYPGHFKFRSCMTLFLTASTNNRIFKDTLLKYFDSKPDQLTLDLLARHNMTRR